MLKKFLKLKIIIISLTFIIIFAFLIFYKMQKDTHTLIVNNINLPFSSLPKSLNGYKIGFVSDPHLGLSTNIKFFDSIIDTLNKQDLDLLLLGGDYIWLKESALFQYRRNNLYTSIDYKENAKNIFKDNITKFSKVKTKDGIIAIYGNHDNWTFPNVLKKVAKNSKIKLAKRENIYINKNDATLSIYTFNDFWKAIPVLKNDELDLKENEFRVILAHNPDSITYINKYFPLKYNLSLSGHTHGGQIKIPFLNRASNTYYKNRIYGLEKTSKNTFHYTSSGIGYTTIPFRFNVKPEIVIFTLKKSTNDI